MVQNKTKLILMSLLALGSGNAMAIDVNGSMIQAIFNDKTSINPMASYFIGYLNQLQTYGLSFFGSAYSIANLNTAIKSCGGPLASASITCSPLNYYQNCNAAGATFNAIANAVSTCPSLQTFMNGALAVYVNQTAFKTAVPALKTKLSTGTLSSANVTMLKNALAGCPFTSSMATTCGTNQACYTNNMTAIANSAIVQDVLNTNYQGSQVNINCNLSGVISSLGSSSTVTQ